MKKCGDKIKFVDKEIDISHNLVKKVGSRENARKIKLQRKLKAGRYSGLCTANSYKTAANSVAPSLTRALALYGNRIGEECTIGPIFKNPPNIRLKKFVKLTDHNCDCNDLTDFNI